MSGEVRPAEDTESANSFHKKKAIGESHPQNGNLEIG